jgi:hypothetical protein
MMLFLLQDTLKEHPIGFETRRRNIFDPEEDDMPSDILENQVQSPSKEPENIDVIMDSGEPDAETEGEDEKKEPMVCTRNGCTKKPRFDSLFCSDSCGVSALESDLLRTFQYSSDIHPSLLRN